MSFRGKIKTIGAAAINALGLPQLFHRTIFRDQLTIVTYHGVVRRPLDLRNWCFVNEVSFRAQIRYLKRHFRIVPFSKAVELLRDGPIDCPTAAVTFDDGFQNNYDVAFPMLRELGVPAIIFLTTGLLNSDDTLWFCRLNQAMARTNLVLFQWDGQNFDLARTDGKIRALRGIEEVLIKLPHPELLRELQSILRALGSERDLPVEPESPFRMLSYSAIDQMRASGLIEFGAHTHSHAILSRLSSDARRQEIGRSVEAVTALTGSPCEFFAYPNGQTEDYDEEAMSMLQSSGVKVAVTAQTGPNKVGDDLLKLRRYGFGVDDTLLHFHVTAHHTKFHIKRILPI
jgi:peptidoglycan/xylan/chitin deacetylase (PgdA/CDA1 family)